MPRFNGILLSLISIGIFAPNLCIGQHTDESKCKITYHEFRERWNDATKSLAIGTWKLHPVNPSIVQDSTKIVQALDGPSLYFIAVLFADGTLKRIDIRAKRDQNIAHASLVAWLTLIKSCNHELSKEERLQLLDNFGITKDTKIDTSIVSGNFKYTFKESLTGNKFSVSCDR